MKARDLLTRLATQASDKSELVAACMIFVVVAMMIIPVPAGFLDVCIAFNITLSALLVIIAVLLPAPLAFSSFPAVLLISTLFRLSISVSTTRLILLDGYTGHVVESFGEFVIGGNVVVGIIVFMIIAVVNFLVVTKGSERVAEVAARFSLDGMPGKQMSIDSDLRAGLIDQTEAKSKRLRLERESQLFGAMDGAVKFVKGDAIAGFIIFFINLLGGLAIGMLQKGMDFSTAGARFSLLSVGDGLVALIPSLMVSIAAGMIVTRVGKGETSSNSVAADMAREVMGNPKALIIVGVFALMVAMIPGMPGFIFVGMALSLGVPWFFMRQAAVAEATAPSSAASAPQLDFSRPVADVEAPRRIRPLMVSLSARLSPDRRNVLENVCRKARNTVIEMYGVNLPKIEFLTHADTSSGDVSVLVHEVPIVGFVDNPDRWVIRVRPTDGAVEETSMAGQVEWVEDPLRGARLQLARGSQVEALRQRGFELEPLEHYWVEALVDRWLDQARSFFTAQELSNWLAQQEASSPDVVKELQRVIPNGRLHDIILRLLSERVSILNFDAIAASVTEWSARERDLVILTEHVRLGLAAQICHAHSYQGVLHGYVVSPDLESLVRRCLRQSGTGSYLDLDDESRASLVAHIHQTVPYYLPGGAMPVLLAPADCRRFVRRLYDTSLPWLHVIAFSEVPAHVKVNVVGELGAV